MFFFFFFLHLIIHYAFAFVFFKSCHHQLLCIHKHWINIGPIPLVTALFMCFSCDVWGNEWGPHIKSRWIIRRCPGRLSSIWRILQVIFHLDSECLRTVAETPVLDDLRIVWAGVTFSRSSSCAYPQKRQNCFICVDTQITNSSAELFLRTVAETPVLDDLRIVYFSRSSSCTHPQKLQKVFICVDTQMHNRGAELFCGRMQKLQYWMICISWELMSLFPAPVAVHIRRNSRNYWFT